MIISIPLGQLNRLSFLDPSGGGRSAKSLNAIVFAGMDSSRRIIVLRSWAKNCGLGETIHQWQLLNDQYKAYPNYYEAVGAYKSVGDLVHEAELHPACPRCNKTHRRLGATPYRPEGGTSGVSKEQRIRVYIQKALEDGRVYIRSGMVEITSQVGSFGVNEKIDSLDALAYCVHLLRPPTSFDDLETEKADVQLHRSLQVSRTQTEYNYGGYI